MHLLSQTGEFRVSTEPMSHVFKTDPNVWNLGGDSSRKKLINIQMSWSQNVQKYEIF